MLTTRHYKFWFCTGSQDLYGDECLRNVAEHSKETLPESFRLKLSGNQR